MLQNKIHKLSEEVINKIAAGEIIQRPLSVVKEMVENSIDSNATIINVQLKDAGLASIKIIDNGDGIQKVDFPLLCERFATSKITKIEDLSALHSFGFRGEALASISFVSHLTVISKRKNDIIASQGCFSEGKLLNDKITSIGSNDGQKRLITHFQGLLCMWKIYFTTWTTEEMLLIKQKKRSNFSTSLFQSNLQGISHHNLYSYQLSFDKGIEFSSQKLQNDEESRFSLISQIQKLPLTKFDFLSFEFENYNAKGHIYYSRVQEIKNKKEFVLFINNRLVESDKVRRCIDSCYQKCSQCIHEEISGFFVYLSLDLQASTVDANVHPNKREVKFINELEINELIEEMMIQKLKNQVQGKSYTQKKISSNVVSQSFVQEAQKVQGKSLVRVDGSMKTLDQYMKKQKQDSQIKLEQQVEIEQVDVQGQQDNIKNELIQYLKSKVSQENSEIIKKLVYIGMLRSDQIICQIDTKLVVMNVVPLLFNYFVNLYVQQFGNYKQSMKLKQKIEMKKKMCCQKYFNIENKDELIDSVPIVDEHQLVFTIDEISVEDNEELEYVWSLIKQLSEISSLGLSECQVEDEFYRDRVIPYIKEKCRILSIKLAYCELLKLEQIYLTFERC